MIPAAEEQRANEAHLQRYERAIDAIAQIVWPDHTDADADAPFFLDALAARVRGDHWLAVQGWSEVEKLSARATAAEKLVRDLEQGTDLRKAHAHVRELEETWRRECSKRAELEAEVAKRRDDERVLVERIEALEAELAKIAPDNGVGDPRSTVVVPVHGGRGTFSPCVVQGNAPAHPGNGASKPGCAGSGSNAVVCASRRGDALHAIGRTLDAPAGMHITDQLPGFVEERVEHMRTRIREIEVALSHEQARARSLAKSLEIADAATQRANETAKRADARARAAESDLEESFSEWRTQMAAWRREVELVAKLRTVPGVVEVVPVSGFDANGSPA